MIQKGSDNESVFCKINIQGKKPIIIGSIYRPPDSDQGTCSAICRDIVNVISKNKNAVFWLGGDFNVPDIDWKKQIINGSQYPKSLNSKLLDTIQDLGLSQVIETPTRGTSFLDLFFTNIPRLIKNNFLISGLGDHEACIVETKLNPPHKKPPKRRMQL